MAKMKIDNGKRVLIKPEREDKHPEPKDDKSCASSFLARDLASLNIGRIAAGSRTKLDTDLINEVSAAKFKTIREVSEHIQELAKN